jgi:metal-responsive CopG/Arc/MetJ family transcriptional regulator
MERNYTTVSIPCEIAERIDRILKIKGYSSRSEYVREAVRKQLFKEYSLKNGAVREVVV